MAPFDLVLASVPSVRQVQIFLARLETLVPNLLARLYMSQSCQFTISTCVRHINAVLFCLLFCAVKQNP